MNDASSQAVVVVPVDAALKSAAELVAARWGLCTQETEKTRFRLRVCRERLELSRDEYPREKPVFVDFSNHRNNLRVKKGGGRRQPLARAAGLRARTPSILDLTAGFGTDAHVLASLGCRVTMVERSPVVAALLEDGLRRAHGMSEGAARMHLLCGDASELLSCPSAGLGADVIYLDPMYPGPYGTAQVRKEMQLLRDLIGQTDDTAALFEQALARATSRVVVKRPAGVGCLNQREPSLSVATRRHRFDVYVVGKKALRINLI